MSDLSIAPTNPLKRPFIPEDQEGVKRRRVSSDVSDIEVIEVLAATICELGNDLIGEGEYLDHDSCKDIKSDLVDILGVSLEVDELYKSALQHLEQSPPRHLDEVELKTGENIHPDNVVSIKKMENIICKWAEDIVSGGHAQPCRFVIRVLTESSKLSEKIDKLREEHIKTYMDLSEELGIDTSEGDYGKTDFTEIDFIKATKGLKTCRYVGDGKFKPC